jgi:hypothetical protein
LLNANQFGFRARHSTTLQCMRLADHVTLKFNSNMFTAAVFLDIEKAFDTTWHPGLLYNLSKLQFSNRLIKLISSILSQRKFSLYRRRNFHATVHASRGATRLRPIRVNLALFADDTCLYATDRKEGYVLRKIQRGLNCMASWCERWNIEINEENTRAIYFTHRNRPPNSPLTLNGRNISFVNSAKYLGVLFDKRMTWRLCIEMIEAKAFRTFIRIYSLTSN